MIPIDSLAMVGWTGAMHEYEKADEVAGRTCFHALTVNLMSVCKMYLKTNNKQSILKLFVSCQETLHKLEVISISITLFVSVDSYTKPKSAVLITNWAHTPLKQFHN